MMKIQYCSDLHLEFPDNYKFLIAERNLKPSADILIIAGDFAYLTTNKNKEISYESRFNDALQYLSDNWKKVIIIPGNHEYYGDNAPYMIDMFQSLNIKLKSNITLLEKSLIQLDEDSEYRYIVYGGTMWTSIPPASMRYVESHMNDYRLIKFDKSYIFNGGYAARDCSNYIEQLKLSIKDKDYRINNKIYFKNTPNEFERKKIKAIVVSHHCPLKRGLKNWYQANTRDPWKRAGNEDLKYGYFCDMTNVIEMLKPEAWIYGHTHATNSFKFKETNFYENSLGYVVYNHNLNFKTNKTFQI